MGCFELSLLHKPLGASCSGCARRRSALRSRFYEFTLSFPSFLFYTLHFGAIEDISISILRIQILVQMRAIMFKGIIGAHHGANGAHQKPGTNCRR